ncbi:non-lysosomal glucosylceramidase [soil metagenome]|jgi:uncharacterized protein (DUF608 family)
MKQLAERQSNETTSLPGRTYRGAALRHIAMPMGGIGTGQVSLCGDGGLRQWELFNQPNHLAFVPDSFFAISASTKEAGEPATVVRILQSREALDLPEEHTPMVNDDAIPDQQRALLRRFSGVERTTFTGAYPFARVAYEDSELPIEVSLEAYSPFVPTDVDASELPAVIFTFRLHNASGQPVRGGLGATLKNVVGWDGVEPIQGNLSPQFGGNVNRILRADGITSLMLDNPSLPPDHPGYGQMALSTFSTNVSAAPRWKDADGFINELNSFNAPERPSPDSAAHRHDPEQRRYSSDVPSGPGETWNGGVQIPYDLESGESTEITVILSWSFPNHYVNFGQSGHHNDNAFTKSRLWLGNAYSERFRTALDVVDYITDHQPYLEDRSRAWSGALLSSSLPTWLAEFLAAQGTLIRSPTSFRTDDGKFYGFEGTQGAPTSNLPWRGFGGSCPLNCTHVWNYEQALSRLFPSLERTMRETDLDHVQAPEGYIPHRTLVPLAARQLWDVPIGGPENPALDGMLGTVLKVYREVRQGAGQEWLDRYWPNVKRLLVYIESSWDPDHDGILDDEQGNTFDIAFYGPNMFIGSLWLAALRAGEEMAKLQGDRPEEKRLHDLFIKASNAYDEKLWNGEYYVQVRDETAPPEQQYGAGCLSDQLIGQWWAHQLDLGYILPEDHVRTTLRSIVRHNFRQGFHGWVPEERVFADGDDAGLLNLTWPHGGRPDVPTRYWDEVWTGTEYQVAAHCIMEGLVDEGMRVAAAARDRYSGEKRNPYNDIECGDHYVRAMSGWTILDALSGYRYNAVTGSLAFAPISSPDVTDESGTFRAPFVTASGWGQFEQANDGAVRLTALHGEILIQTLVVPGADVTLDSVRINGSPVDATVRDADGKATVQFPEPIILNPGDMLQVDR